MRTPEEIIGADLMLQLAFEGYEVVRVSTLLPTIPDRFDAWYAAYPRKVAKPAAKKAYAAAIKRGATHEAMMAGVARLVASRPDPQYTPYPASWLNKDQYNDVPMQAPPAPMSAIDQRRDALRQELEQNGYGRGGERDRDSRPTRYLPVR